MKKRGEISISETAQRLSVNPHNLEILEENLEIAFNKLMLCAQENMIFDLYGADAAEKFRRERQKGKK